MGVPKAKNSGSEHIVLHSKAGAKSQGAYRLEITKAAYIPDT